MREGEKRGKIHSISKVKKKGEEQASSGSPSGKKKGKLETVPRFPDSQVSEKKKNPVAQLDLFARDEKGGVEKRGVSHAASMLWSRSGGEEKNNNGVEEKKGEERARPYFIAAKEREGRRQIGAFTRQ